jgi:translation initiation factor 4A
MSHPKNQHVNPQATQPSSARSIPSSSSPPKEKGWTLISSSPPKELNRTPSSTSSQENWNETPSPSSSSSASDSTSASTGKPGSEEPAVVYYEENESNRYDEFKSFDNMNLSQELLRGIYGYGFEKPSPIQTKAIVPLLKGRDVIAQAQSGGGKTGAFLIGCLQLIDPTLSECQVLILANARELAIQTSSIAEKIGTHLHVGVLACIGGNKIRDDLDSLRRKKVHMVVATPGRALDLIYNRKELSTKYLKILILDEADLLLSSGFKEQIQDIFHHLPADVQVGLFSATLPPAALELSTAFMRNPVTILMKRTQLPLEGIKQFYVDVGESGLGWKYDTLCDLYSSIQITQAVVFVNTKRGAQALTERLERDSFPVSLAHSDMDQNERTKIFNDFREGRTRVLVATDLYARGIDAVHVSLVINFDLPLDFENYLHRVGRCGRFGKKGVAINLISRDDARTLHQLEQYYNTEIRELPADVGNLV